MAYLRGNSYVDGNLIVEGALQVKRLTTSGNDFPYLLANYTSNTLAMFGDNAGGLKSAPILIKNNILFLGCKFSETDTSLIAQECDNSAIRVFSRTIKLNKSNSTWEFE